MLSFSSRLGASSLAARSRMTRFGSSLSSSAKSFAFSGSGWLVPFFFGVIDELRLRSTKDSNVTKYIDKNSFVAGTSGGSIASLVVAADIDAKKALEFFIDIANKTRKPGMTQDMDALLKTELKLFLECHFASCAGNLVPERLSTTTTNKDEEERDFLNRINKNKNLNICVTKLKPFKWHNIKKPYIVNQYDSISCVINTVAASCFIPFYSHLGIEGSHIVEYGANKHTIASVLSSLSKALNTILYRKSLFIELKVRNTDNSAAASRTMVVIDGGLGGMIMPPVGDITISPFSAKMAPFLYSKHRMPKIAIDLYDSQPQSETKQYKLSDLVIWGAKPPSEDVLRALYAEGKRATQSYLNTLP
jgi:hypothetical protein